MGKIDITIKKGRHRIGTLRLDDILIVPSLDRRLFSVNSFLSKGNRRVLFQDNYVELTIKNGPKIRIPITSLQSNIMIVNTRSNTERGIIPSNKITQQKVKINTNLIHNRFYRSNGIKNIKKI